MESTKLVTALINVKYMKESGDGMATVYECP